MYNQRFRGNRSARVCVSRAKSSRLSKLNKIQRNLRIAPFLLTPRVRNIDYWCARHFRLDYR